MVGRGENLSNRVLPYAASVRGTRQYWFQQRSRLIAMVDTLGIPTISFMHSDFSGLTWHVFSKRVTQKNLIKGRLLWRIQQLQIGFLVSCPEVCEVFYVGILGASDYWLCFEWQHRGSPHIHGLAWLTNAPNVEEIIALPSALEKEMLIKFIDRLISTCNPAILSDGSNAHDAPPLDLLLMHVRRARYTDIIDHQ